MSEHQPIDSKAFRDSEMVSRPLTGDERERVRNHLLHDSSHVGSGYEKLDLDPVGDQELVERFLQDTHAHESAILRGEITAPDLWPHRLSILSDSEF